MADNVHKTPLARTLNRIAQNNALSAIQLLGKALPASVIAVSGSIVTVKFELNVLFPLPTVTCPLFGPEYIRYPIQLGDRGVVFPADAYLGGISGLGGGVATLAIPANLSALVFFPVGSTNFTAPDDPNSVVIYGPDGVIIRDRGNACSITLTPTGVTLKGNMVITGNLQVDGTMTGKAGSGSSVGLTTHTHPDPQGGNSGSPNPGT